MMKLRINPFVVTDLKEICDYIAEDNAMRSIMRSGCVSGGDCPKTQKSILKVEDNILNMVVNKNKVNASNDFDISLAVKVENDGRSDTVFGQPGGGSTLYELCACGTPAITYVLADNQIENAVKFESTGYMMYAGDCRAGDSFKKNLAVFWEYGVTL